MGSSTPATTNTQSSSQPWSAATPMLSNLISQYSSTPTAVTAGQTGALNTLTNEAAATPNMGAPATGAINTVLGSSDAPQVGMINSADSTLNSNLGATASGANLNPYSTPGFSDAINTMTNDITNSVKGQYAGSGRDPSGAGSFAGSLGRGLTQGIAPTIAAQYNTNEGNMLGANTTLNNAANTAATNEGALNSNVNSNLLSGVQGAGMLSNLYTQPGQTQLAAANTAQNQPFQNLQPALTAGLGLGALGTSTTGTSTSTPANNPLMNILGGISTGAGLMFSDRALKENIRKEGEMPSGLPIKSYNMKHDPFKQRVTGFIAQDVAKKHPEAVHQVGRFRAVHYPHALQLGMIPSQKAA